MSNLVKKLKIAIISLHPSNRGGVLSSLRTVFEFCSTYFEPHVFCLGFDPKITANLHNIKFSSSTRTFDFEGMPCTEIGARWPRWEPGHYAWTIDEWKRVLEGYDYFFVTSGTPHAAHPLVLLDKKFILWLASTYFDDRKDRMRKMSWISRWIEWISYPAMAAIERTILRRTTVLAPISTYTYSLCESIVGKEHGEVKLCPVPVSERIKQPRRKESPLHIVTVGRFTDPRKNIGMLLRMSRLLFMHDNRFVVDVVGLYPQDDERVIAIKELFGDRITFHGQVSDNHLQELYEGAFAAVITSYQEGLSIVGLEAMSWGVPVIATRCGGVADYVISGQSGFLVDINDEGQMVNYLCALADDSALYESLQYGALATVRYRFSKSAVFEKFKQALCLAYPELKMHFIRCDAQRGVDEHFGSGTCVSGADQSAKVDHIQPAVSS